MSFFGIGKRYYRPFRRRSYRSLFRNPTKTTTGNIGLSGYGRRFKKYLSKR